MDAGRSLKIILGVDSIKYPLTGISRLKSQLAVNAFQLGGGVLKRQALADYTDHLFHGPNFYLPAFGGIRVATFHDISMFRWSQCPPTERVRFIEREVSLILERASFLITDSEYTRQEVSEYFSWLLDKIRAVSVAASGDFSPREEQETSSAFSRFGLKFGGYSLYLGTIALRKNIDTLLKTYSTLPLNVRHRWPLGLCGYRGWMGGNLHDQIAGAEAEGWVRYFGYVSAGDSPRVINR